MLRAMQKYRRKPDPSSQFVEAIQLTLDNYREVHEFIGLDTTPTEGPDLLAMHVGWFATVNREGRYAGYPPKVFHSMYEPVPSGKDDGPAASVDLRVRRKET